MELDEPIPLAWQAPIRQRIEVIEVYPAATMLARGASLRGYKKRAAVSERRDLLRLLAASCDGDTVVEQALGNDDCLDAFACVVAGLDFLEGAVVQPWEADVARKEGWIWFRPKDGVRSR
jgi:hypothetical protein